MAQQMTMSKQIDAKKPTLRSPLEFLMTGVLPTNAVPDEEFTICTEPLEEDVVKVIACKHSFHCVCVLDWFTDGYDPRNRTCPNCRTKLYEALPTRKTAEPPEGSVGITLDEFHSMMSEYHSMMFKGRMFSKIAAIFALIAFLLVVRIAWRGKCEVHYDIASGSETGVTTRF
jgi:hypothetical protein